MTASALAMPPPRPEKVPLYSMYVEPSGALVVGTIYNEFFRTEDNGAHWTFIREPASFEQLVSAGLSPARQLCRPRTFGGDWHCIGLKETASAVDDRGALYDCDGYRIAISDDGGKRWHRSQPLAGAPPAAGTCHGMAVLGNEIYVFGDGFYRSADRGAHWTTIRPRSGVPVTIDGRMSPMNMMEGPDGLLYATTRDWEGGFNYAIQTSSDGGRTWMQRRFGLPEGWRIFMLERITAKAVYFFASPTGGAGEKRGLYRSTDGETAERINIDFPMGDWLEVQEAPGGIIYLGYGPAIYRSDDGGKSWHKLNRDGITW